MSGKAVPGGTPGLLERLLAAVRPGFRADVLVFDPEDPVFGSGLCLVDGCTRAVHASGMCGGHLQRWNKAGRPEISCLPDSVTAPWFGHGPLGSGSCQVPGCRFGISMHGLCDGHAAQWRRAGRPDAPSWAAGRSLIGKRADRPSCLVGYCGLRADAGAEFCRQHRQRWRLRGRPDPGEFARECENPDYRERVDLTPLPRQLRLEVQYALQCRRDDTMTRTKPGDIRAVIRILAASGASSLLAAGEEDWRRQVPASTDRSGQRAALLAYAHRQVAALAEGPGGWDREYPRDTWRLRRLGIAQGKQATLQSGGISQPWLKEPAKRWTRWRISTGLSMSACYQGLRALRRFSAFCGQSGVQGMHQVSRELLERYLAALRLDLGQRAIAEAAGELNTFLLAVRRHGWEPSLPATAMLFPGECPRRDRRLPRALAAHVAAQAEDPANLDLWSNPSYRLITVILIRCGLRISSATGLPPDCVVTDADGAPYLRYHNTKMKREALVPIDDELQAMIAAQRHQNAGRWPGGTPVLFPRPHANIDGTRPVSPDTYRSALGRWLERCDIRDEHGEPVHLTPHQWRHTLGTVLINRDVPQHVVQKILDHDSPLMTALYARLSDKTVREHWESARKVGAEGQPVQISPGGPLGDAAWAKQQLSRATQALPNGYCQLPLVRTCPHANSCLTCPMFVTTAEFLPQHHAQRQATLQIISAAEAAGHARVAEMNRQVAGNLDKIIATLEDEGTSEEEASAGAS